MSRAKFEELFPAVVRRIESLGLDPSEYDVIGLMDDILADGVPLDEVNRHDFLFMLSHRERDEQTTLPCPDWCTRGPGHPFESESHDGIQSRPHAVPLPLPVLGGPDPREVYLSLSQEDERVKCDDSKSRQLPAAVSFAVDAEFQAAELRKLAGALLDAADKLDEVNGVQGWTEDRL